MHICYSNSKENKALEPLCKQEGVSVQFKYTAPCMAQQNGRMERKFATLFNQLHAMLKDWKFSCFLMPGPWAKEKNDSTFLESNLTTKYRDLSLFL